MVHKYMHVGGSNLQDQGMIASAARIHQLKRVIQSFTTTWDTTTTWDKLNFRTDSDSFHPNLYLIGI